MPNQAQETYTDSTISIKYFFLFWRAPGLSVRSAFHIWI